MAQIEISLGRKFKCAFCRGLGIQPHFVRSHCMACRGKGEVEFKKSVIQCPACGGKGRASHSSSLSCIRCRGIGLIERSEKISELVDIEERLEGIIKRVKSIKPFRKWGDAIKRGWQFLWED